MSRDEMKAKAANWTCFMCVAASTPDPDPVTLTYLDDSINEVSSGMKFSIKNSLRILQWNAGGLKTKSDELDLRLKHLD